METLETQVAKIIIGNFKQTTAYVYTLAEKAVQPECELYTVIELPLFNPAAHDDCERIAQAVSATLKRAYRRDVNDNTFEVALGEINEELGKLATLGQTNWIGKLNAIIAVKQHNSFTIATTGKVTALLLRENEITDITDSPKVRHPLKTFENYATGKLKNEDLLVLSTAELFNHISIDRLQSILTSNALGLAAQHVVKILEDNAGPETAFGSLLMYFGETVAETTEEPMNLEEFLPKQRSLGAFAKTASTTISNAFKSHTVKGLLGKAKGLVNKRPSVSITKMAELGKKHAETLQQRSQALTSMNWTKIKSFSGPKKFFLISALILLLAITVNIFVARHYKSSKQASQVFTATFQELQNQLNDANSSYLYKDEVGAGQKIQEINTAIKGLTNLNDNEKKQLEELQNQITDLQRKLDKITELSVTSIASLTAAEHLIVLPNIFATETNGTIISFNKNTGTVEDGVLKSSVKVVLSVPTQGTKSVIYDGQGLQVWDFSKNSLSQPFFQSLPKASDLVGLKYYATNSRVYTIDKAKSQILNFLVSDTGISKPVVWSKSTPDLGNSIDLAIDGNLYVLNSNGVNKYTQGRIAEFSFPALTTPLSGKGKIWTDKDSKNIYILDSGNKRVVVLDKKGQLVQILMSNDLSNPSDFTVDEVNKTLYILNNGSLLKATY